MTNCLNCGKRFKGQYCPHCGQKAKVERLTLSLLAEELVHTFTHLEKGFFYTTWNFLVRPGKTILGYLKGKRKNYQKPVSFFLIWIGLYVFIHNYIIDHYHYQLSEISFARLDAMQQGNVLLRTHFTIFIIPLLLVTALTVYLILARPLFNFIEILASCLYGGGTYFGMLILSDIITGAIFKINTITTNVFLWQSILSALYNFWFSFDFFKRVHLHLFWFRLISVSILVAVLGWALMDFLPLVWIYFTQ